MALLRQLCLPLVCALLHQVLHTTKRYKECIQIADSIASEHHQLYKVRPECFFSQVLSFRIRRFTAALVWRACAMVVFSYNASERSYACYSPISSDLHRWSAFVYLRGASTTAPDPGFSNRGRRICMDGNRINGKTRRGNWRSLLNKTWGHPADTC